MQPYFFADTGQRLVSIRYCDIIFIEASRNYASIVTTKCSCLALVNLRQLETILPRDHFCRIHRSYIVAIAAIQAITTNRVYLKDRDLPIGDSFRAGLYQRITIASQPRLKNVTVYPDVADNY